MKGIYNLLFLVGFTISSYGQSDPVTDFTSSFIKYSQENLQEKIYAHTDKSFYVSGEIIWFKLYNVDACLNQPSTISKVAYVELIGKDQKPVVQAKIDMKDGTGSGSFFLPFSYTSGVYILRAYTHWMKNFSPAIFFEKPITVVNTLKRLPAEQKDTTSFSIRFFPEGGNLVGGLESKLAFHAVDNNGNGKKCTGVVYDRNNDSVASFASARFGMGSFKFIPVKGEEYKAVVNYSNGKEKTVVLPVVYETGYVIQLNNGPDSNTIRVSVVSAGQDDRPVYLLIHSRQLLKLVQAKNLLNGQVEFLIDKKSLGEGVSHFTLFNTMRKPVCERLYFKRPHQKLGININMDQQEYASRQRVGIGLSTNSGMADLSMAVFLADSLQSSDDADIQAYFWLCSELRGRVESPDYYFTADEKDVELTTDNLMLTHGWSRFKWEEILSNGKPAFRFLPEYERMIITGKISDKYSGLPAANILTYLSVPGEKFVFRSCTSDKNGNIFFSVDRFYGNNTIVVQAQKKTNEAYKIEMNSPFFESGSSKTYFALSLAEKWKELLLSYSIGSQVENTFVGERKQQFLLQSMKDSTPFFGYPDKTYFLDDYTRFITMEEVMREYVAEVRVRKESDDFSFRVKNEPYKLFFENDPLILLDGVPVLDLRKFMEFDPLKIKKLDVVTRKYFTGKIGIEGIVSYSTYKGNLEGFSVDPEAVVMDYSGLQLHREFYSPAYDTKEQIESPLPDFRNVLFWSPDIKTSREGAAQLYFYTSDRPGRYAVFVQGLTAFGLAGSNIVYFTVGK